QAFIRDWLQGEKTAINQHIAADADAIVTGLYEYDCCYRPHFPDKTHFIPFPSDFSAISPKVPRTEGAPIRFFVGIQRERHAYKGTDIMLRALERVKALHPDACDIVKVENVPFDEYQRLMSESDVILDQLYSYTPAMNALLAMAKGLIVVGGGEEENYEILNETELRPIINVLPNEEDCFKKMEQLVLHPEQIPELSRQSVEYIRRHHDHIKVAKQYESLYSLL
ncbi:MAG: glycosyltransferase, partial [Bacteroidaceae bacterium]|nr:glycosyltransferase [Bacteroidaceae bacterium]